jgi:ankyrin repeat protein
MCKGGNVSVPDSDGNTVLHSAISFAGLPEVSLILNSNPPLTAVTAAGDAPLHVAARMYASTEGADVLLSKLSSGKADANAQDAHGVPPLCYVAAAGNDAAVASLLAAGADANAADKDGRTALHWLAASSIASLAAMRANKAPGGATAQSVGTSCQAQCQAWRPCLSSRHSRASLAHTA